MADKALGEFKLREITHNDDKTVFSYISYLKEDFVNKSLLITLDGAGHLCKLYFSSNDHGTLTWLSGRGIVEAHRWEDEDDLDGYSDVTRRFPSLMEDGFVSGDFALNSIVPDVLCELRDNELMCYIRETIQKKAPERDFNWNNLKQDV
jgi:hypothetical protein